MQYARPCSCGALQARFPLADADHPAFSHQYANMALELVKAGALAKPVIDPTL